MISELTWLVHPLRAVARASDGKNLKKKELVAVSWEDGTFPEEDGDRGEKR